MLESMGDTTITKSFRPIFFCV